MDCTEIGRRFTAWTDEDDPTGVFTERVDEIEQEVRDFAFRLNDLLPDSREKSSALSRLEEVWYWAEAAVDPRSSRLSLTDGG